MIEISESLGRQVDKFKAGTGPAPPMEAFMSDESLAQVEKQTAAAAPVHAEDLTPISREQAASRTMLTRGGPLPSMPTHRRVIPEPFRRPSIHVTHHGRTWQPCRADAVDVGDTVPDVGVVTEREIIRRTETVAGVPGVLTGMKIKLTGAGGVERVFDLDTPLRAHRKG